VVLDLPEVSGKSGKRLKSLRKVVPREWISRGTTGIRRFHANARAPIRRQSGNRIQSSDIRFFRQFLPE